MLKSQTISIPINRPYREVYEFLAEPRNFPSWASNLGSTFEQVEGPLWVTETRKGRVLLRFATRNEFGVLDHAVYPEGTPEPPATPMRVIANGDGAEVLFTLLARPGMTEEEFASELEWTRSDFEALRSMLESRPAAEVVFDEGTESR